MPKYGAIEPQYSQMREEATDVAEEIDNSVTIKLPLLPCWDESDDGVPGVGLVWVVSTLCSPFPTYSLYCSALQRSCSCRILENI